MQNVIDQQASSLSEMAATIEELTANVNNITQISSKASDSAKILIESASGGKEFLNQTNQNVSNLVDEVKRITDFAELINNISSRTNLLAMNAAIEAAHAGEAGKGFAVVAEEIRKLSDEAAKEVQKVKTIVTETSSRIEIVTSDLDETQNKFNQVMTESETVNHVTEQVKNAMEEQSRGNSEMVDAISSIQATSIDVKSSVDQNKDLNQSLASISANSLENSQLVEKSVKEMKSSFSKTQVVFEQSDATITTIVADSEAFQRKIEEMVAQLNKTLDRVGNLKTSESDSGVKLLET